MAMLMTLKNTFLTFATKDSSADGNECASCRKRAHSSPADPDRSERPEEEALTQARLESLTRCLAASTSLGAPAPHAVGAAPGALEAKTNMFKVGSNASVSTMAPSDCGGGRGLSMSKAHGGSSNSVCTLGTDSDEREQEEEYPVPVRGMKQAAAESQKQPHWLQKEYRHVHVPRTANLMQEYEKTQMTAPTTMMIRNIPNRYTQNELIAEVESMGFAGTFDFFYLPLDKGTMSNVGYAFVNFVDATWAEKCRTTFQNARFQKHRRSSGKIAAVSVAHIQGLEANIRHYENAAVSNAKHLERRPVIMANLSRVLDDREVVDEE